MYLERFYDEKLAQASYLVGCSATGEALVVDPNRAVERYIEAAGRQGLRITHVVETHIHADFVSGTRELADRTGAVAHLSDEGGEDWKYAFADASTVLLNDGDAFMVGNVRIDALHTPGHTPEHLSFLVTDTAGADEPMGVFTGDFVFVGDVGRPDLLEKAARIEDTMEDAARTLFRSLRDFEDLPDYLQVWPGHGAGSACGKALGAVPQSSLGYEKRFNWAFSMKDEDEFVRAVLADQPEPPTYFAELKRVNREGPPILGGLERPRRMQATELAELVEEDALVIDARRAADYAQGHVPGTVNIPLNRRFNTWAGWLVPYDRDVYLVIADDRCPDCIDEAVSDLAMIGLDRVAGWFGEDAVRAWEAGGRRLRTVEQITVDALAERLDAGGAFVIDVRGRTEWEAGHLPEPPGPEGGRLLHIPLGHLPGRLDELPRDEPIVVHCQSGARSAIAASVLEARGIPNVINLEGGFGRWRADGHPVEREAARVDATQS